MRQPGTALASHPAGEFAICAVSTVDEGIEVLTGDLREDGSYPQGTVRYLVEQRLDDMTRRARDSGKGNESDANGGNEKDADDR